MVNNIRSFSQILQCRRNAAIRLMSCGNISQPKLACKVDYQEGVTPFPKGTEADRKTHYYLPDLLGRHTVECLGTGKERIPV
jgi:hypothetical protein